ncbi:MAG: RDD family protein [Bacteriovoracaceae bacterium]|jgi:uncharacterized RDD family membrane protein YckC|nr:RDD family protein [Bacteriovoracaceae bacterium]
MNSSHKENLLYLSSEHLPVRQNSRPTGKKIKLNKRVYAFYVDMIAVLVLKKSLILSYISFMKVFFFQVDPKSQFTMLKNIGSLESYLFWAVSFSYFFLTMFLGEGKTLGKLIFGQRVVARNEEAPTALQACLRTYGYLICMLSGGLLFIIPALRSDGLGVADFLSGTYSTDGPLLDHRVDESQSANIIYLSPPDYDFQNQEVS